MRSTRGPRCASFGTAEQVSPGFPAVHFAFGPARPRCRRPASTHKKRPDAYKKVPPVAGIAEQGLVPDPDVMHTLFARLFAILGPDGHIARDFRRQLCQHCLQFCRIDYRWARPEATTARFGHDSAAAGQGTKGRDKRWLRGPRLLQPGKRPGWRGGGLLSCAAVSSTNLLVFETGRKFYLSSQASLPESKRSALAVSLFLFDPPTHPGNRCSGEQGGVAVAASSSGAGSGGLQGTRAGASVREQAQSALIQC